MTVVLLAVAALAWQRPYPSGVTLPPGWRTEDQQNRLVGPNGERIEYPYWGSPGTHAAELRGADPKALFGRFVLGGRPVEVALARDGRLAVSYPGVRSRRSESGDTGDFAPYDYEAKVETARQAADVLLIALTHVEAWRGVPFADDYKKKPPFPAPLPSSAGGERFPGYVQLPPGYVYRPGLKDDPRAGRFESEGSPTIEYRPDLTRAKEPNPANPAQPSKWRLTRTILGREIHIAEGEKGFLTAWTTVPEKPPHYASFPIFSAREVSPRAAVALVLARLSFSSTEG